MRTVIFAQALGVVLMVTLPGATGTLFMKLIGGTDAQALLFGALTILSRFIRIPCSIWVDPRNAKTFMLISFWIAGVCSLLAVLWPSWHGPSPETANWVMGFFTIALIGMEAGKTYWWPLLHPIIPPSYRGRFFSSLRITWGLVAFACTLLSGLFFGSEASIWQFQVVLGLYTLMFLGRNLVLRDLPEAPSEKEQQEMSQMAEWRAGFAALFKNRRVFSVFMTIYVYALFHSFLSQPFILYMESRGVATGHNVMLEGLSIVGMVISLLFVGRFADSKGTRKIYLAAQIVFCVLVLSVPLLNGMDGLSLKVALAAVLILAGICKAAVDLAMTVDTFHHSPVKGKAFFISAVSLSFALFQAGGPFITSQLVHWQILHEGLTLPTGHHLGFYESLYLLVGLGAIFMLIFFRPPGEVKA